MRTPPTRRRATTAALWEGTVVRKKTVIMTGVSLAGVLSVVGGGIVAHAIGDPVGLVNVDPNGIIYTDDGTCPKADVEITLDTGCYQGKVVSVSVLQGQADAPGGIAVSGYGPGSGAIAVSADNAQAYGTAVAVAILGDAGGSGYDYNIYQCSSPNYASEVAVAGTGGACGSLLAVSGGRGDVNGEETRAWSPTGVAVSIQDPTQAGALAVSGTHSATAVAPESAAVGSGDASAGMVAVSVNGYAYACGGPVTLSESASHPDNPNPGCPGTLPLPIGSVRGPGLYAS
jgi:hypothetical protein